MCHRRYQIQTLLSRCDSMTRTPPLWCSRCDSTHQDSIQERISADILSLPPGRQPAAGPASPAAGNTHLSGRSGGRKIHTCLPALGPGIINLNIWKHLIPSI